MKSRLLFAFLSIAISVLGAPDMGWAQKHVPDPCLEELQVEATSSCLLDNGGSFTATVKLTNPCDHAVDLYISIAHEAGPTEDYTEDWVGAHWQTHPLVTLQAGESKVIEGGSPNHPPFGWYLMVARLSDPVCCWAKKIDIGKPEPVCYPFVMPTVKPPTPTRTPAPKGSPVFKGRPTATTTAPDTILLQATPTIVAEITPAPTNTVVLNEPTQVPQQTNTPVVGGSNSSSGTSSVSLMVSTIDSLFPFFAPSIRASLSLLLSYLAGSSL